MYLINTPEISDLEKYQLLSMELGFPKFQIKTKKYIGEKQEMERGNGKKNKIYLFY